MTSPIPDTHGMKINQAEEGSVTPLLLTDAIKHITVMVGIYFTETKHLQAKECAEINYN